MDKNNFIRQVMKERGWTIERLASQMTDKKGQRGITQSAASQIINGNPTLAKLQEIADILDVPIWKLLVSAKEIHANSMVAFFHYNGRSHTPTTIDEIMSILKDWKEDEFHSSCHRHDFQHIREKYAEDGNIQRLMDSLCALLHEDCNNTEISITQEQ